MVDISLASAHDFWSGFSDPYVYRAIVMLESVENNMYDGEKDFEDAMAELGNALEDVPESFSNANELLSVLAYLRTSRYLRVLQAIDVSNPGMASRIIAKAEGSDQSNIPAQTFLHRNIIFERFRLLARVFSTERLRIIAEALEE